MDSNPTPQLATPAPPPQQRLLTTINIHPAIWSHPLTWGGAAPESGELLGHHLQASRLAIGDEPCQGLLQQLEKLP